MELVVLIAGWVGWLVTTLTVIVVLFDQDKHVIEGSWWGKVFAFGCLIVTIMYALMALRLHTSTVFV